MVEYIPYIYHEAQDSALCAVHCLNGLLQGPYFSAFQLSSIAQDLDREERALMGSSMYAESHNVGMDGNFSIQVLRRALGNLNLKLVQIGSEDGKYAERHPEQQNAFVCNLQAHWFAIRKINGTWYDLNSLSGLPETPAKPTVVSDFFLSAKLASLKMEGYSIYVVLGKLPRIKKFDSQIGAKSNWYLASTLKTRGETYDKKLLNQVDGSGGGGGGTGSTAKRVDPWASSGQGHRLGSSRSGARGMGMAGGGGGGSGMGMGSAMSAHEADLQKALALSMQAHQKEQKPQGLANFLNGGGSSSAATTGLSDADQMKIALAMSMEEESSRQKKKRDSQSANKRENGNPNLIDLAGPESDGDDDDDAAQLARALAMSMEENGSTQERQGSAGKTEETPLERALRREKEREDAYYAKRREERAQEVAREKDKERAMGFVHSSDMNGTDTLTWDTEDDDEEEDDGGDWDVPETTEDNPVEMNSTQENPDSIIKADDDDEDDEEKMEPDPSKEVIPDGFIPDEPSESLDPSLTCTIVVRLPNGKRMQRRFLRTNFLGHLANAVQREGQGSVKGPFDFVLPPMTFFSDPTMELSEVVKQAGGSRIMLRLRDLS